MLLPIFAIRWPWPECGSGLPCNCGRKILPPARLPRGAFEKREVARDRRNKRDRRKDSGQDHSFFHPSSSPRGSPVDGISLSHDQDLRSRTVSGALGRDGYLTFGLSRYEPVLIDLRNLRVTADPFRGLAAAHQVPVIVSSESRQSDGFPHVDDGGCRGDREPWTDDPVLGADGIVTTSEE